MLCICQLETKLNLDPDPNLQIISDPAGSGIHKTVYRDRYVVIFNQMFELPRLFF